MPAAAAVAVWATAAATAAGATAATAALVGAVASAAVTGAIVGGVLGAVTAVISGGNILEGTLKGALIGGVVGGVTGGIGHLVAGTTAVPAAAAGAGGGDALAGGLTAADYAAIGDAGLSASAADVSVSAGGSGGLLGGGAPPAPTGALTSPGGAASVVPKASPTAPLSVEAQVAQINADAVARQAVADKAAFWRETTSGTIRGAAEAYGATEAAKTAADTEKEKIAMQAAQKETNRAGDLQPLFRRYTLPENWIRSTENLYDKYRNKGAPAAGSGLLAGGVA